MTRNALAIATAILAAAMLAAALLVAPGLPEGAALPVHWNIRGVADGFAGKWVALLTPAGLTAGIGLLLWFLPALEPRRTGLVRSQGLYLWSWAALLPVMAAAELAVLSAALGWDLPMNALFLSAVGVMLVLIGNQLGKSRSMYLVGIRTPWTLASEEVWIRTHRLGGKLMVLAGLAFIAAAILDPSPPVLTAVLAGALGAAVGVPVVYSYLLWRRERRDQPSE